MVRGEVAKGWVPGWGCSFMPSCTDSAWLKTAGASRLQRFQQKCINSGVVKVNRRHPPSEGEEHVPLLKTICLSAAIGVVFAFLLSYLIPGINGGIAAGSCTGVVAVFLANKYFKT